MLNWIISGIETAVNTLLWGFVAGICCILNFISDIINFLANKVIMSIFFGTNGTDFSKAHITPAFKNFMLVAVVLWMVFFVITILNFFRKDLQECDETPFSKKIFNSLKQSTIGLIFTVVAPFCIFLLFWLVNNFSKLFLLAITNSASKDFRLGDAVVNIGSPSGSNYLPDPSCEGIKRYPLPSNIGDWNIFLELVGLIFILMNVLLIIVSLAETLYNMFFMFILTAVYAFSAVFDDGARMKQYCSSMIANSLVVASTMAVFALYVSLLQTLNQSIADDGTIAWEAIGVLKLAIAIGGASFILSANESIISRLVGENIPGLSHAKSNLGSIVSSAAGAAMLVKGAAKKAGGFAIGKKNMESIFGRKKGGDASGGGLGSGNPNDGGGGDGSSPDSDAPFDHNAYDENGGHRGHFGRTAAKAHQTWKNRLSGGGIVKHVARLARSTIATVSVAKDVVKSPFSVKARANLVEKTNNIKHKIGNKVAHGLGYGLATFTGAAAAITGANEFQAQREAIAHHRTTHEGTVSTVDRMYEKTSNKKKDRIQKIEDKIYDKQKLGKWSDSKVAIKKEKQKVRKEKVGLIDKDRESRKNTFETKTGRKLD